MSATGGPRFGIWANVYGMWASMHHPDDPRDASWERNRRQILLAEELGFDSTLIAQHTINPFGHGYDQLEDLDRVRGAGLDHGADRDHHRDQAAAVPPGGAGQAGAADRGHQPWTFGHQRCQRLVPTGAAPGGNPDPRARRALRRTEWLTVVRGLISGERVSFHGRYFDVDDYQLVPASQYRRRPTIYVGGESNPAKDLVASSADVWFLNGQPEHEITRLIAEVRARPRRGDRVRLGMAAFVIARESEVEAQEALAYAWELAAKDAPEQAHIFDNADPKAVMFQTFQKYPAIGTNGGTAAGLVGSYEQVAERIRSFHELGIELFMLQFQPFEAEMERFAREVIPRVRAVSLAG